MFRPLYHSFLQLFRVGINRFGEVNEMNVRAVGLRRQQVEKATVSETEKDFFNTSIHSRRTLYSPSWCLKN